MYYSEGTGQDGKRGEWICRRGHINSNKDTVCNDCETEKYNFKNDFINLNNNKMRKIILILVALMMVSGIVRGQVKDTSVLINKDAAKDVSGRYTALKNRSRMIFGLDTAAASKISALIVYDISPKSVGRDTLTFRDTLTSSKTFATYNLGSQYTYVTIAITRGDTNKTNMDSIKTYSLSTYGDTAQTALRNLRTFTDGDVGIAGSSANSVVGYATQKYMLLDPICKYLHIRAVNAVLTNRIYILTIRAVRQ